MDEGSGLYSIDVNIGPGSGVHILNRPPPQAFVESMRYGQHLLRAAHADALLHHFLGDHAGRP